MSNNKISKKTRFKYLLQIKRNINSGLEVMSICSNLNMCKDIVKQIFETYVSHTGDTSVEPYNSNNWEHSKKDDRYWFYTLNDAATAYYQIMKLPENALACAYLVKKDQNEEEKLSVKN